MSARLFHYCCGHSARGIDLARMVLPGLDWSAYDMRCAEWCEPASGLADAPAVVWLTDMAEPDRDALGLTSHMLSCDRTEFRYTVRAAGALAWLDFAREHGANPEWLSILHEGRAPERWFVSIEPCRVLSRIDRRRRQVPA